MNALRGRLFEFAEALGWPEKREKAFKGLIRQYTYDTQTYLEACLRAAAKARDHEP